MAKKIKQTNAERIEELRNLGYFVWVTHEQFKYPHLVQGRSRDRLVRASTTVELRDPENKDTLIMYETSHCSLNDEFRKSVGLSIALGRLEKKLAEAEVRGVADLLAKDVQIH